MRFSEANWQKDFINYLLKQLAYNQFRHLKFICWNATPELGAMDAIQMNRAKAMGFKVGITDLQFWWVTSDGVAHFGFLELKRPERRGLDGKVVQVKGKMSPGQIQFQAECKIAGVRHDVAYTIDEAIAVLKKWGVFIERH